MQNAAECLIQRSVLEKENTCRTTFLGIYINGTTTDEIVKKKTSHFFRGGGDGSGPAPCHGHVINASIVCSYPDLKSPSARFVRQSFNPTVIIMAMLKYLLLIFTRDH